jgi:hypothetical protein
MPDSNYKRLTWRRRRPSGISVTAPRSTLLIGEDHILKVESTLFSEDYKRFFFRDIQSIAIKTNGRQRNWNGVLVVLLAVFLLEGLLDAATWNAWAITMMILASIAIVLLLVNNVFGVACDVRIQTAVQTDILTPLSRVKRANQALERLRPLIIQAQGQITAEEAVLRLRELTAPTVTSPGTASPTQQVDL